MKKILIAICAVLGGTMVAQAQNSSTGSLNPVSSVPASPATQVTYQGKMPYSQYVEQEKIKQQQKEAQLQLGSVALDASSKPVIETKPVGPQNKYQQVPQPKENNMVTKAVTKPETKTPSTVSTGFVAGPGSKLFNAEANKTATAGFDPTVKQSPANNTPVVEKPVTDGVNGNPGIKKE
jgi:hypothetical protein